MWYSPEIKRAKYFTYQSGWAGQPGEATEVDNPTSAFGQWMLAYIEEKEKTTTATTVLGAVPYSNGRGKHSPGAQLITIMIWDYALTDGQVKGLAEGHLPGPGNLPIANWVGDHAHDAATAPGSSTTGRCPAGAAPARR